jgi:hypothetical protein
LERVGGTASLWTLSRTTAGTRTTFTTNADQLYPGGYPGSAPGIYGTPFFLTITTSAAPGKFGATASTYTLSRTTSAAAKKFGATASSYSLSRTTAGTRKTFATNNDLLYPGGYPGSPPGIYATPFVLTITTAGATTAYVSGATSSELAFNATTAGTSEATGVSASSFLAVIITTAGHEGEIGTTHTQLTFAASTAGARTVLGATSSTFVFSGATAGSRTTFGTSITPITLTISTTARGPGATFTGATASVYTFHVRTGEQRLFRARRGGTINHGRRGRIGQTLTGDIRPKRFV